MKELEAANEKVAETLQDLELDGPSEKFLGHANLDSPWCPSMMHDPNKGAP